MVAVKEEEHKEAATKLARLEARGDRPVVIQAVAGEAPMVSFNRTFRGSTDGGRQPVHILLVALPPLPSLASLCICINGR